MAKNKIYIKNSSKDVNCGLHDLKIIINTDGGRIKIDKNYIAKFKVDYGDKKNYKTDLILIVSEKKEQKKDL